MTELEQHILAYYATHGADNLQITGRFYPHGELVLIIEDKMTVDTRKFGSKVTRAAKPAALAFADRMIAAGAWSTKKNEYGGTMHQFQGDVYKKALKELQDAEPVCVAAKAGGETFWADAFAALTA